MQAVTWHGKRDVRVESVPDPIIERQNDAIIEVTSSGLCGSDLHLYEVLGPFLRPGDILGHEPMGTVVDVGPEAGDLAVGDRVVVPFNISCGHCWMCRRGLQTQCETTQVRDQGMGAALFGYTELYGQIPGAQAQYLRVPEAQYGPIKVPAGPPDDRFLFLSDVLPTAWQAVAYADVPSGGSLAVLGVGPIGEMCIRVARHRGIERIIAVDPDRARLERARALGAHPLMLDGEEVLAEARDLTDGRGPDAVIDAVGLEAEGDTLGATAQAAAGFLPRAAGAALAQRVGIDRLTALHTAIELVRRGGTISIIGVYGGAIDPMPMLTLFDKQIQLRMGQANVKRWVEELLPLLIERDVLGVDSFASHHVPLEEAPVAYDKFQKKEDGTFKVVFRPNGTAPPG